MRPTFREVAGEAVSAEASSSPRLDALAVLLGLSGAALFSMKAILIKLAYQVAPDIPVVTLITLRLGLALPVYIIILLMARRAGEGHIGWRQTGLAMAAGLLAYYLCAYLDFQGLKYITAQLERLLLFTYPAFVVLFGALFFGHCVTAKGLAAIALAYSGLAIVFIGGDITQSSNLWLGVGFILACAMVFAMFQLIAKRFIDRIGARVFTCLAMIGAATMTLAHFLVQSGGLSGVAQALDWPREIWGIALALAVFSTLLPSFFINIAMGRIGAQRVAVLGMFGPLATIIAAIFVLGEPFGLWDGVGTAVTLLGIAVYTRIGRAQDQSKASPRAT